jgi:long-chain acyl-CoA synthetase
MSAGNKCLSDAITDMLAQRERENALAFGGRWFSWGWFGRSRDQLDEIFSRHGLNGSGSCALIARNRPPHVAAMISQLASHRPLRMIYSVQSAAGIASDLVDLSPDVVLLADEDRTPEVISAATTCGALLVPLTDGEAGAFLMSDSVSNRREPVGASVDPAMAVELLSSGTTGKPKRVPLSWETIESMVTNAHSAYAGTESRQSPLLMVHPLGNIAGIAYLAPAVAYGQRIVLLEKFEVRAWENAVRTHRPFRSSIPPVALRMILEEGVSRPSLESLGVIAVGGGKLDPALQDEFERVYGIPVLTAYGATEFGGVIANWTLPLYREFGRHKKGSAGRASQGVALRVVDSQSFVPLAAGEVGILEVSVPRIGSDWMRTSDLACVDQDGFLFLRGRADSAINRGGFKIIPERVADVLREHPAVKDAAVMGMPDPRLGEVPVAAVELHGVLASTTEDELLIFARSRLLKYEVPQSIRVLNRLPRNAAMKISEPDLRRILGGHSCK